MDCPRGKKARRIWNFLDTPLSGGIANSPKKVQIKDARE
jgi:hypothetical protein